MSTPVKNELLIKNATVIKEEVKWFSQILHEKMLIHFKPDSKPKELDAPDLKNCNSPYATILKKEGLSDWERLVVLLAMMPTLSPEVLDDFYVKNDKTGKTYTQFGGKSGSEYSCFMPTVETAIFLLGGSDFIARTQAAELFSPQANFPLLRILDIQKGHAGKTTHSGILGIKKAYYSMLVEGRKYYPRFGSEFPAEKLTTLMVWDDLVLNDYTSYQVDEILHWMKHHNEITKDWDLHRRIREGYRALFFGPSGTGKTLTATLLGQRMKKDVYRVDLSQVVSKWIGETEKNLANIFNQAEDKDWILFFDEADALFGKRVNASSSNDQHSNQQIAYLLQRVENYPGVVILATNFRGNMDKAFARRFQSIIHFALPKYETRLKLWQATLPKEMPPEEDIDVEEIAKKYKITGGMIANIVQYAVIESKAQGYKKLAGSYLMDGIMKELAKEGKS